jgi:hypothetical protein
MVLLENRPLRIRKLEAVATVATAKQSPQDSWFLMEVTSPAVCQLMLLGAVPSLLMGGGCKLVIFSAVVICLRFFLLLIS